MLNFCSIITWPTTGLKRHSHRTRTHQVCVTGTDSGVGGCGGLSKRPDQAFLLTCVPLNPGPSIKHVYACGGSSVTSWMAVRSPSSILSNSSMQQMPLSASTSAPPSNTCARPIQHVRALSVIPCSRSTSAPSSSTCARPVQRIRNRACSSSWPLQARYPLSAPLAWLSKSVIGFAQRSVSQHGSTALHCSCTVELHFVQNIHQVKRGHAGRRRCAERQTPEEPFACVRMPSNTGQGWSAPSRR